MRAIAIALLAIGAFAQQPARVEFEVVSIKRGDPADPASSAYDTRAGMQFGNTTLANLIRNAYQLNEHQLDGGPKWKDSARFHIDAKFPAGAKRDQGPQMLQSMLADRFKLEFHRETRTLPQYALVVAKGGPKLEPAKAGDPMRGATSQGDRQIKGWGLPVSSLARMLISAVGAPVVDKTGLEGEYNFVLEFASLQGENDLPSIFTILQERLGLKLEATKGPVEVLVIDRVEMPSEN